MKFLPCDSAVEAKQKSCAARNEKNPNWWDLQLAKHLARPNVCPHPARYQDDPIHNIVVDPNNDKAEIEIPDGEEQYYPADIDNIRNTRAIAVAQGPPE